MFNNGNQNQQRIGQEEEDGPEYRSVMIRPQMSLTPLPSMNSKLVRTGGGASNKQDLVLAISSPISSSSFSSSSSSPPRRWTVQELTELPTDYMLVRTNVYVNDSNPQLIADGICNTLKSLSITIDDDINKSFEGEENAILAETQNGVKFTIRLFSHNSMVVVEIQRASGCSFEFRDAAKVILRSAKTGLQQQHQQQKRIVRPERRFTIPLTLPKRSRDDRQKCIQDDFKIACNMLRSNKSDMQVLALESMEHMTKKSCEFKDVAAKSILGNCDHLKQLLLLLCDTTTSTTTDPSQYSCLLRRKVLAVLANSFEAISTVELAAILSTNDNDLIKTRSFLSSLLSSLQNASILPHDAYQAVRCLRYLLISKEVETAMIQMSVIDVISSACSNGCNFHEGLEQESNKLMMQLQQKFVC